MLIAKLSFQVQLGYFLHFRKKILQITLKRLTQIWSAQSIFHRSLQESQLISYIITDSLEIIGIHRFTMGQYPQSICKLNLTALARQGIFQNGEYLRRNHITPQYRHQGNLRR